MAKLVGFWAALLTALAALVAPASATLRPPTPRVYVWGDSLTVESKPYISLAGLAGAIRATIGQAPCDYLKALTPKPGATSMLKSTNVLVIETAGNSDTKCMLEPNSTKTYMPIGSSEWEAKYRRDLDAIVDLALSWNANDHIVLLDPPPMDPTKPLASVRDDLMNTVYPQVQNDEPSLTITSSARDAIGGDTFMQTMPCLADETTAMGCDTSSDTITVRAPDGLHFCPTGLGSNRYPCSLPYDPGARRFGNAIDAALHANL